MIIYRTPHQGFVGLAIIEYNVQKCPKIGKKRDKSGRDIAMSRAASILVEIACNRPSYNCHQLYSAWFNCSKKKKENRAIIFIFERFNYKKSNE